MPIQLERGTRPVGAVRERPKHREGSEAPFAKRKTPEPKPRTQPHPPLQGEDQEGVSGEGEQGEGRGDPPLPTGERAGARGQGRKGGGTQNNPNNNNNTIPKSNIYPTTISNKNLKTLDIPYIHTATRIKRRSGGRLRRARGSPPQMQHSSIEIK